MRIPQTNSEKSQLRFPILVLDYIAGMNEAMEIGHWAKEAQRLVGAGGEEGKRKSRSPKKASGDFH